MKKPPPEDPTAEFIAQAYEKECDRSEDPAVAAIFQIALSLPEEARPARLRPKRASLWEVLVVVDFLGLTDEAARRLTNVPMDAPLTSTHLHHIRAKIENGTYRRTLKALDKAFRKAVKE